MNAERGAGSAEQPALKVCSCGLVMSAEGKWVQPAVRFTESNSMCPVCVQDYRIDLAVVRLRKVTGRLDEFSRDQQELAAREVAR